MSKSSLELIGQLLAGSMLCWAVESVAIESVVLDLFDMPIEQLMQQRVTSASGVEEKLKDAPATMLVVTASDIRERGYTDLTEVFLDLPGFDSVFTHGTNKLITYQRGYRTPFTQRTLFMVDGKVDNHLWSHGALINRQYPISHIKRIEILYGPASAVYGANAFLGVVNIITKSASERPMTHFDVSVQAGDYSTAAFEVQAGGTLGKISYEMAGRIYQSEEPGLDDLAQWGYASDDWLGNKTVWGPILDQESRNRTYGSYSNRSENESLLANIYFSDIKLGYMHWRTNEGYGVYYAHDHVQPNQTWNYSSDQIYLEHENSAFERLSVKTLFLMRENRVWGGWAEAFPDSESDNAMASWVTISQWNSDNSAQLFKQDYHWRGTGAWQINGGINYEKKTLTKAYDICGYYEAAFCSSATGQDLGPEGLGAGIAHSTAESYWIQPGPLASMPDSNLVETSDSGGYLQGIYDKNQWRINLGIRYDKNDIFGGEYNPRVSAIYRLSENQSIKLLYGEAFQEAAPIQLYGSWNGRRANPDLVPETAQNIELVYLLNKAKMSHSVSLYLTKYANVIKEQAENAGERENSGLQYHGRYFLANPAYPETDMSAYFYYTYADSQGSETYNHSSSSWEENKTDVGDIAPHKINTGVNLPLSRYFNLNLRANWVSEKTLYSRNPLRAQGEKAQAYTTLDGTLLFHAGELDVFVKVKNILDEEYYHSGVGGADSGNDFDQRARGYNNSLIPQVERNFMIGLKWRL